MPRNYYLVLGVPSDASPEEIRDAYRRLVKSSHPDVSGEDTAARFRDVQEAWETLGDAERRRAYDTLLKRAQRQASHPRASPVQSRHHTRSAFKISAFDAFEEFVPEPAGPYVSAAGGPVIHFGLQMTAAEAATGGEFPLQIPVQVRCSGCAGSGYPFFFLCPACQGRGYRPYRRTVALRIPAGLTNHSTLEVPLADFGFPHAWLILHVEIEPMSR